MIKIDIICVNYNSYPQLEKYLFSLQKAYLKCDNLSLKVYIADNSSTKEDFSFSASFSFELKSYANLGYLGGAFAVINSEESIRTANFVIISNVDLQVDENFFINLLKTKIDSDIGWIAPQIWSNIENRDKNPQRITRPSGKRIRLLYFMFSHPVLQSIYKRTFYKRKKINKFYPDDSQIYCGHGSFIILTKSFFVNYDQLNYPCFLYCEELFLAELIRNANLKVIYNSKIKVIDDEHISTGKLPSKKYYEYNLAALEYIYKTFYLKSLSE